MLTKSTGVFFLFEYKLYNCLLWVKKSLQLCGFINPVDIWVCQDQYLKEKNKKKKKSRFLQVLQRLPGGIWRIAGAVHYFLREKKKLQRSLCKHRILKCAYYSCFVSFAVIWLSVSGNEWLVLPSQWGQYGAAVWSSLTFAQVWCLQLGSPAVHAMLYLLALSMPCTKHKQNLSTIHCLPVLILLAQIHMN